MDRILGKLTFFTNEISRLFIIITIVGVFSFTSLSLYAIPGQTKLPSCAAPAEYKTDLAKFLNSIRVEQDFSCLTDLSSISAKLSQYQLVNIQSNELSVENSWKLSIHELKLKSYLRDRKLLLLGNSFSRVEATNYCAILKKNGFSQVKLLVGGAPLWVNQKQKASVSVNLVTSRHFVYEYFNGTVVVVAASQEIAKRLALLGVDKSQVVSSSQMAELTNIVINKGMQGYWPVVLISDDSSFININTKTYPNLYVLDGGITALESQFKMDVMTDLSRFDTLEVAACENSKL